MYEFNCGDDSKKTLKDTYKSQSKNIKFEEYKKNTYMVENIKKNMLRVLFDH